MSIRQKRLRGFKPLDAGRAFAFSVVVRWDVIPGSLSVVDQLQVPFEFHVEATVLDQHVPFQMSHPDGERFKQGAHHPLEKVLTGVALVVFFDMDVTVEIHGESKSFDKKCSVIEYLLSGSTEGRNG
jgi:hypothetical protein